MYKQACAERGKKIYFMSEAVPSIRNMIQINTDQRLRTFPLQFLRVHHKTVEERHWVMLLHPDEYLYHDPRLVRARRDVRVMVGWLLGSTTAGCALVIPIPSAT